MEMRFGPTDLYHASSIMKRSWKSHHGETESTHQHEEDDTSLSLSSLSKIILPPLGVSSYNQNPTESKGWIISPMDSRYRSWESFMVVLVAYSAWVFPFEVAFLNASSITGLYIADNIVDLFFAVDIVLTFLVAYIDSRTQLLVRDRRKIAVRYLSTWFLMDVASTVPFELLGYLFTGKEKLGLSYSLLGILRFWRLRRVKQLFTRLEKDIRFSYFWIRCIRLLFRNSIEAASNFVCRNHLPPRLKDQILAYMCLRFKAESLNQNHLIEQLPKTICKSICHHLFLPTVEKVYLFNGVSREILLLLVAEMKAEYIPPREDVVMQNEAPEDVYIIVSGEVEIIDSDLEKERVVGTLHSMDMFGEVGALCCRPQSFTFRTKTLSQLLRLKTRVLIESMQTKQEDYVAIIKNFLQHHKKLKDLKIAEFLAEGGEEEDPNMAINLLTVASTGNAAFLEELLKAKLDPDNGDSKGRTPLHIAASKGHEECVLVLLRHGCNIHLKDVNGNTALWEALSTNHQSIFRILFHFASISDPHTAGDLLCTAARRNDLTMMKKLLKQGLNVDSKDRQGKTAIQIAVAENNIDMVDLLVMNGADVTAANTQDFNSTTLNEMLQKREIGHHITVPDDLSNERLLLKKKEEEEHGKSSCTRVSIYRGHPLIRKQNCSRESGRLIRLPSSMEELKNIAGKKFGFDARNAMITDEEGSEIDSIEVIRDNDKLFIVEDQNSFM
ncbi:potassium channel AKT2/3 isoform X2 [Jatropha curcas]|uniref:potassium channel AKT2/3 isoform X2 n=1 Tax=Jatropha curcas TaxID=180498 RepID=UPI00189319A1|nr:potassium channel AKT2/3 isoform X2 [Jatropha curcas]